MKPKSQFKSLSTLVLTMRTICGSVGVPVVSPQELLKSLESTHTLVEVNRYVRPLSTLEMDYFCLDLSMFRYVSHLEKLAESANLTTWVDLQDGVSLILVKHFRNIAVGLADLIISARDHEDIQKFKGGVLFVPKDGVIWLVDATPNKTMEDVANVIGASWPEEKDPRCATVSSGRVH